MPYLAVHFHRDATEEQYRATQAALPPGLPEGLMYQAAGPTEGGFLISSVWDSRESLVRFLQDTLGPKWPVEGGLKDRPEVMFNAEVVDLLSAK